jgi:hypothetical protein
LKKLIKPILIIIFLDISLLISGYRFLIYEHKVNIGDTYFADEWGNLGGDKQANLFCKYFTGRSIKMNVYWYSSNNIMGRDSCPFLTREL